MERQHLVIFDLDGTLIDTSEGIVNSVRYAEKMMGLPTLPKEKVREFLGPPPKSKYMELYGLGEEDALKATKYHREYGSKHAVYESAIYEGMKNLLDRLRNDGFMLAVATLKLQSIAEQVLGLHGIADKFDRIAGMDAGEGASKSDLIQKLILQLQPEGKTVLIGDSLYDLEGAKDAKTDFIGVGYGFGFRSAEEEKYKTIYDFAADTEELYAFIIKWAE